MREPFLKLKKKKKVFHCVFINTHYSFHGLGFTSSPIFAFMTCCLRGLVFFLFVFCLGSKVFIISFFSFSLHEHTHTHTHMLLLLSLLLLLVVIAFFLFFLFLFSPLTSSFFYFLAQVGPLPWLGPQTKHVVKGFAERGYKNLLVVRICSKKKKVLLLLLLLSVLNLDICPFKKYTNTIF